MEKFNNFEIELSDLNGQKQVAKKIQVLRVGDFDHPVYGKLKITKDILKTIKINFDSNVRKIDLAVDYGHNSGGEAAGWIKRVSLSEDGSQLWADVDWSKEAFNKIADKQYRYISADFDFSYKDAESGQKFGAVLLGAALTNRPFLKGMAPTTELMEVIKMDEKKLQELEDEKLKLAEELKGLNAKLADVEKAKEAMLEENKALKQTIETAEKLSKYEKLLSEGKITPAQKDDYLKGDLEAVLAKAPKITINLTEAGHANVKLASKNDCDDDEKEMDLEDKLDKEARKMATEKKISVSQAMSDLMKTKKYSSLKEK